MQRLRLPRNPNRPRCPMCDSAHVYFRRTTKELLCQTCGHAQAMVEEKEVEA